MKSVAAGLKSEALQLDPSLGDPSTTRQGRSSSVADAYKTNYTEGLQIKAFREGLGEPPSNPKPVSPTALVTEKAGIIRSLAAAGKSPEEIETYLSRLGPHLDLAAMASDPVAQSMLYSRVMGMGNSQQLSLKDVVETLKLVNDVKGPQQQSVTELVAAMGSMFQSGVQAASKNNSDPMQAFDSAVKFVTPIMQQQTETVKASFENQLNMLKTEIQQRDPSEFFRRMKEMAGNFGWGPPVKESPEVAARRIDLEDKNEQRNFEWNRLKYETDMKMKEEVAKDKRQSELLGTITGTLSKAFESPVIRELGRNVGSRLGVKDNPLAKAQVAAAQSELSNPTAIPYRFMCPACQTPHTFTALQLTKISEAGGRWACDKCGAPYELGRPQP